MVETRATEESLRQEVKQLKNTFRKKEQKMFNQLEETKLSLAAYQMQLDIERSHFDVLVSGEKQRSSELETQLREIKVKMGLVEEKLRNCEEEIKNKRDAETSCSSRNLSLAEEPPKKKTSIFAGKGQTRQANQIVDHDEPGNERSESSGEGLKEGDEGSLQELVESIRGDPTGPDRDLFVPSIRPIKSAEMDEYHDFNVSMIKAKVVNPLNESVIVFDNVDQKESLNASLSEFLRYTFLPAVGLNARILNQKLKETYKHYVVIISNSNLTPSDLYSLEKRLNDVLELISFYL